MFAIEFGSNSCTITCTVLHLRVIIIYNQSYISPRHKIMAILIKVVKNQSLHIFQICLIN